MEDRLRAYLKRYRQDIVPAALVVAAIVLIWIIIFPQIGDINELRGDIEGKTKTNQGLRDSQNTLNSIDDAQLDDDYELVLRVLPANKSMGAIFEALNRTASRSNVAIGSLNLQVGSVYEQEENNLRQRTIGGVPFLNLLVRVSGNSTSDTTRFAQLLYQSTPLVEVNVISATNLEGRYDVDFFFKPVNTSAFQAQTEIHPLSPALQEVLSTLRSWDQ